MSKRLQLERSKLKEIESINFESKKKDIQDLYRSVKLAEVEIINDFSSTMFKIQFKI